MTVKRAARLVGQVGSLLVLVVAVHVRGDDCDGSNKSPRRMCSRPSPLGLEAPVSCAGTYPNYSAETCGQLYEWVTPIPITPGCNGVPSNPKTTRCVAFGQATGLGWIPETVHCGDKYPCKKGADGICASDGTGIEEVYTLKFGNVNCDPPQP